MGISIGQMVFCMIFGVEFCALFLVLKLFTVDIQIRVSEWRTFLFREFVPWVWYEDLSTKLSNIMLQEYWLQNFREIVKK